MQPTALRLHLTYVPVRNCSTVEITAVADTNSLHLMSSMASVKGVFRLQIVDVRLEQVRQLKHVNYNTQKLNAISTSDTDKTTRIQKINKLTLLYLAGLTILTSGGVEESKVRTLSMVTKGSALD